jgi:hypothetical protein
MKFIRKNIQIILSVVIVGLVFASLIYLKTQKQQAIQNTKFFDGEFTKKQGCGRPPYFLQHLKIQQPVVIDLSQKRFKGIAFHHGKRLEKTLHPKQWESFDGFGTYSLDEKGNLYLAPMPYISIGANTFEQQKNIYQLDSLTGKLSVFMRLDDVVPGPNNPYGIYTLVYDCEDQSLWVAAIDETDYHTQRGVIYHIDPKTKTILQQVEGFDAQTLNILQTTKAKYLLAGSAKDSGLYAYLISNGSLSLNPVKLLELPSANDHIRKIKIKANNHLQLQVVPFSYTLIAQSTKKYRNAYDAQWINIDSKWELSLKQ